MYDLSDDSSTSSILAKIRKTVDDDNSGFSVVENNGEISSKYDSPTSANVDLNISTKFNFKDDIPTWNCFTNDDLELQSIMQKYGTGPSTSSVVTSKSVEVVELSSSDEEFPRFSQTIKPSIPKITERETYAVAELEKVSSEPELPVPTKRKKLDKNQIKLDRAVRQAKKSKETEKEKLVKEALKTANKVLKPDECIKFVTVMLDNEIANDEYGGDVLNSLRNAEMKYHLESQIIPSTVVWTRQLKKPVIDGDQVNVITEEIDCDEILLIMKVKEIIEAVNNNSLITYIQSLQSMFGKKKLHLALYGLKNYFKYYKSLKQKELQSRISEQPQKTNKKKDKVYENIPKVGRKQLENSLVELQIMCSCCYRMVETPQDVGSMIVQFTKSIAQAPHKLEKQQKHLQAEWYIAGDNKDCVSVDKNGNGLKRLWQQQFTAFPLARLEHAEAITNVYSTPSALIKEYENCNQDVGEKLLEDIPVRRAAGPFTTVRNIGPELSRKIYIYFSSTDGEVVIK